jgi:hypothetical protein
MGPSTARIADAMDLPRPPAPTPPPRLTEELEARLRTLLALRQQMLELHARLEYLRLMLRISAPTLPPHG